MGKETYHEWRYRILVDDSKIDGRYRKGTRMEQSLVHGTFQEINQRLFQIFDYRIEDSLASNETTNILMRKNIYNYLNKYMHGSCYIEVNGNKRFNLPGEPYCYCDIIVRGILENVKKIDTILKANIEEVDRSLIKNKN